MNENAYSYAFGNPTISVFLTNKVIYKLKSAYKIFKNELNYYGEKIY